MDWFRIAELPSETASCSRIDGAAGPAEATSRVASRIGIKNANGRAISAHGTDSGAGERFAAVIRGVHSFSGEVVFGGDGPAPGSAKLPYESNSLRFEFAAPVFGNESETAYQFFLEGADRDWREWSRQAAASYAGIAPGAYRLHVRAQTVEGRVGDEASYAFTILPPWYEGLPAKAGRLIIGISLMGLPTDVCRSAAVDSALVRKTEPGS